jgi:hypothetical protein
LRTGEAILAEVAGGLLDDGIGRTNLGIRVKNEVHRMSGASWMRKLWLPAGLHEIAVEIDPHALFVCDYSSSERCGAFGPRALATC